MDSAADSLGWGGDCDAPLVNEAMVFISRADSRPRRVRPANWWGHASRDQWHGLATSMVRLTVACISAQRPLKAL